MSRTPRNPAPFSDACLSCQDPNLGGGSVVPRCGSASKDVRKAKTENRMVEEEPRHPTLEVLIELASLSLGGLRLESRF